MNIYYVYAYLRSKNSTAAKAGTPYYIGKGSTNRATDWHARVPVPKDKSLIILCETNLSELGAYAIERKLIHFWGRKDIGTGILLNRTNGGDSPPNRKGTTMSDSSKKKISQSSRGRKHTKETKQKMSEIKKGKHLSAEHKKNLSISHKGQVPSDDTLIKRSASLKGRSWWNDGTTNKFIKEQPDSNWTKGRIFNKDIKSINSGRKWWNDGVHQTLSKNKPKGWTRGRLN